MQLLCLAHRGEAQIFLKGLKPISSNLYEGKNHLVLITGEGIFKPLTRIPFILGKYKIEEVINYGIAGSLSDQIELGNIYPLRTVYGIHKKDIYFHSYSTTLESKIDAITTSERVLDDKYALELYNYAAIVDREAWAIASACHEYKIPFKAFKLISDRAGSETSCFDIKAMAEQYSQKMFDHFTSLEQHVNKESNEITLPFHASFTQKKRIEKLQAKLTTHETELISQYTSQELKQVNANAYIEFLENKINPINKFIQEKLEKTFLPITNSGAEIQFDKKMDRKDFTLKMTINSQSNIDNLKRSLDNIKFSDFESIINGNLDV